MWTLTKEYTFEAAHQLPNHDGKCRRLHGHSWRMRLILQSPSLNLTGAKSGMVMDFGDVSKVARPFVDEKLDHHFLNDTKGLANPTSEELARWIFQQLKPALPELMAVRVDETCTCSCTYEPMIEIGQEFDQP